MAVFSPRFGRFGLVCGMVAFLCIMETSVLAQRRELRPIDIFHRTASYLMFVQQYQIQGILLMSTGERGQQPPFLSMTASGNLSFVRGGTRCLSLAVRENPHPQRWIDGREYSRFNGSWCVNHANHTWEKAGAGTVEAPSELGFFNPHPGGLLVLPLGVPTPVLVSSSGSTVTIRYDCNSSRTIRCTATIDTSVFRLLRLVTEYPALPHYSYPHRVTINLSYRTPLETSLSRPCPRGAIRCGNACVNLQTDAKHCGRCKHICRADLVCKQGRCQCSDGGMLCDNQCKNLQRDAEHCGRCKNKCLYGQICKQGRCRCPVEGAMLCDNHCKNLQEDAEHCGRCKNKCHDGLICKQGQCLCPSQGTLCGGFCKDLQRDQQNCGECKKVCGAQERCVRGKCEPFCSTTEIFCAGQGTPYCAKIATDARNCGACGKICLTYQTCVAGHCRGCSQDLTDCEGTCVSLHKDPANCGACGHRCSEGSRCVQGRCESCPTGLSRCQNQCVDTSTNTYHCGRCGNTCHLGQSCMQGQCKTTSKPCAVPKRICGHYCVDVQKSFEHCGACDRACKANETCKKGHCTKLQCSPNETPCHGACVDLQTNPLHCGRCNKVCHLERMEFCDAGRCRTAFSR